MSLTRLASCMLASGSDDGTFSIHDLRSLKSEVYTVSRLDNVYNFLSFLSQDFYNFLFVASATLWIILNGQKRGKISTKSISSLLF